MWLHDCFLCLPDLLCSLSESVQELANCAFSLIRCLYFGGRVKPVFYCLNNWFREMAKPYPTLYRHWRFASSLLLPLLGRMFSSWSCIVWSTVRRSSQICGRCYALHCILRSNGSVRPQYNPQNLPRFHIHIPDEEGNLKLSIQPSPALIPNESVCFMLLVYHTSLRFLVLHTFLMRLPSVVVAISSLRHSLYIYCNTSTNE